jgi:glycosyltransferase involved in cell wall biosynthesis
MVKLKKILVLTYWDFNDALIQTYTLPYLYIISKYIPENSTIYLLTLNKNTTDNINFTHPQIKVLQFKYIPFGLKAIFYYSYLLIYLFIFILTQEITHIHAWCTPAGLFGYILSIVTRRPLIIDSYEPHAEAMVEVGEWKKNSLPFRLLFYFEKKMTHHAKYLIATTEKMITEYAVNRYSFNPDKNNWFVKPACVNLELFKPDNNKRFNLRKKLNLENKIIGIYAGKFGGIYLENEVFEWIQCAVQYWGDKFRLIVLSSHSEDYILHNCQKHNIESKYILLKFVPHKEVPDDLNIADFALTPVKPVYTKKFCSPIKNGEYWAMGLPVIITKDISDDSDIIQQNKTGVVIENLTKESYIKSIKEMEEILHSNKTELRQKIRNIAFYHRNFQNIEKIYQKIYK